MANDMNLMLRIRVNADGTAQALNGTQVAVQRIGTEADNASSAINRFSGAIARVGHYGTGLVLGLGISSIAKDAVMLADKMTLLDSRVKIATSSLADYRAANTALTQIAKATGSSLEANITLFGRLNKSVESSGGSFKTTLEMITTLNEGFKISGASTEEAKSVMIQLSQALSSGVLRGDEFNSVMENGSRIVDALTTATGKTKGELRAMAEAGQLSSEVVINALHAQAAAIHRDFAAIPLTIGAALENISTSWARYLQDANNASGATSTFANSLNAIATHFTPIADGLTTLAQVAVAVFAVKMTGSVMSYVTTLRAARAAAAEAAALELAGASLGVASGFTLASVAMGALNAGIAIFIGWKIAEYLNQFGRHRDY